MVESQLVDEVDRVLGVDREAFQANVEQEAERLKNEVVDGTLDNPQGLIGLEYEFYAVRGDDPGGTTGSHRHSGALCRIPRRTLTYMGFEKELGLHNAEMSTTPQPMNAYGLAGQLAEVRARLAATRRAIAPHDMRFVSDGMWTIPPTGETAMEYLTDSVEIGGITVGTNMSEAVRYHAMANTDIDAGMRIDAPHVSFAADTIMPESLLTSIQPHYQVPRAEDLADRFRYALRVAGPLLAIGVNSPFFPPSLYDEDVPAETILADAFHEHRIPVFESTMNSDTVEKVRFPRDIASTAQAIDRIVEDTTFVPMPVEETGRFDDRFAHFRHKHGTYWRWIRPVFGGASQSSANARIEFRPLPGQPTIRDSIAFQAAFAGAVAGMASTMHPVRELDWEIAKDNFYAAMRGGLSADFEWITSDGERTDELDAIYGDVLDMAQTGLREQLIPDDEVASYLDPLRHRVRNRRTPAQWKLDLACRLLMEGEALSDAIVRTKRAYLQCQAETLLDGSFAVWPGPEAAKYRTRHSAPTSSVETASVPTEGRR